MFKIGKIEPAEYYIDRAMDLMQKHAEGEKRSIDNRFSKIVTLRVKDGDDIKLDKRKDLELTKIRFLNEHINGAIRGINRKFPDFRKLDDIYIKLINTNDFNVEDIKRSINILNEIGNACDEYTQKYVHKIKTARTHDVIGFSMKKYLGKVNSQFKKNKDAFTTLERARQFMEKLPKFEPIYTVCIAGFPNVGKSTLMKAITGADVEIQNYPFTTKGLMFGYIKKNDKAIIQLVDTPGLLNRSKSNQIEEKAKIVINEYSKKIIFVLDVTESCGYSLDEQIKLLKNTSEAQRTVYLYLSKTDIFTDLEEEKMEDIAQTLKKYKVFKNSNDVKETLIEEQLKEISKFDPNKLKVIR